MSNSENQECQEKNSVSDSVPILRPRIFWILLTVGLLTIILGLFSILSVVIANLQQTQFNYSSGLLIGFLLVIGGFLLIIGIIILKKWTPPQILDIPLDSS